MREMEFTRRVEAPGVGDAEIRSVMTAVYHALLEKGYDPISQMAGYLLSEDPAYITNYNNARVLIRRLDRDEVLRALLRHYLNAVT